ncbi:MAG: class I SAM-dependent methyltransferase [Bacteroidetes bacterium]|nr:class I SAM-dependent methyltransferase [Bacteroidota bacterium]
MKEDNYLDSNREAWNDKVDAHLQSDFYNLEAFKKGWNSLNDIELPLLGDVKGKSILHLQCHFGQDTLSLARMGAQCTGVDLSDKAIETAKNLAEELKLDANFIASDVYSIEKHLSQTFDRVFCSYGTIGWLPDLTEWARLVAKYLKPGGEFLIAEFHPFIWMYNADFTEIEYSYFNRQRIEEFETGSYADREAEITSKSITWNHDLSEVIQSLRSAGLELESFDEYDYSPYNCFNNLVEISERRFQIKGLEAKLPMVYALKMRKP